MDMKITSFTGKYRFLSNFYPAKFLFLGHIWPSSEHCYQAMKRIDEDYWMKILDPKTTAGDSKRMGKNVVKDPSFDSNRIHYMRAILNAKFGDDPDLMQMLKETAPAELIEGNTWGDTFWGQCPLGNGNNHLGRLLMEIRDSRF
jgi:ribA/ribD-fused uncharacterized protein